MTNYLKFTEENDWEGETWYFYLPVEGNEAELEKLRVLLAGTEEDCESDWGYQLAEESIGVFEVDILVKHSPAGYMAEHNKVAGLFTCPYAGVDLDDVFYKGGITDFFAN